MYAHNSQPLSELKVSPHKIVFHPRPRIPLTFDLNFNRNTSETCISQFCSQLTEQSHYDKTDLNPFFYETLSKPIFQWILAVETAMLQSYSTVHEHAYITKTYYEGKPLPLGAFVLKRNFSHVHFLTNLNPFVLDHTKYSTEYPMLHMNSFHKMVPIFTFTETT